MVRGLIVAVVLTAFGMVMVGCHAQNSGTGNDASSMVVPR